MASERVQRQIDSLSDETEEAIASQDWRTVGGRAQFVLRLFLYLLDFTSRYISFAKLNAGTKWNRLSINLQIFLRPLSISNQLFFGYETPSNRNLSHGF